jgi:hypothetical protein
VFFFFFELIGFGFFCRVSFGIGTRMYFEFIKYIMFVNVVLLGVSCINYIPYLVIKSGPFSQEDLYISSYPRSLHKVWLASNILSIILWFVSRYGHHFIFPKVFLLFVVIFVFFFFSSISVAYYPFAKYLVKNKKDEDHDNPFNISGEAVAMIHVNFPQKTFDFFLFSDNV